MKFAPEHKVAYLKALVTWACIACWIPLSFYVHENLFNVFVFISYALFLMCGLAVFLWIAALVVEVGKPEHKDASGDWKRKVTDKSLVDTFATPLWLSTLILRSCKGEALTKFDSVFVEEI